jgi:hypothetical protein
VIDYNYTDTNGNAANTVSRTVTIIDTTAPVLSLNGSGTVFVDVFNSYIEPGATYTDNTDGIGAAIVS